VASKGGPRFSNKALEDKNLERLGFTKYVKSDKGGYEKTVGKGPDSLQGDG
jgi:hypothetical protein